MTLCRAELDTYKVPPHPDFADGYWLVRRSSVGKPLGTLPAPEYGEGKQFSYEFDICYELSADYQRKTGRKWSKGINPFKCTDGYGRLDLKVKLQDKKDPQKQVTTSYSHLVACCLLKADRGVHGRRCDAHYINLKDHTYYEADHNPFGDQCDCRLDNLVLEHKDFHRGFKRHGWQRTSLPNSRRGLKRPRAELQRKRDSEETAMKKPAPALRPGVTR